VVRNVSPWPREGNTAGWGPQLFDGGGQGVSHVRIHSHTKPPGLGEKGVHKLGGQELKSHSLPKGLEETLFDTAPSPVVHVLLPYQSLCSAFVFFSVTLQSTLTSNLTSSIASLEHYVHEAVNQGSSRTRGHPNSVPPKEQLPRKPSPVFYDPCPAPNLVGHQLQGIYRIRHVGSRCFSRDTATRIAPRERTKVTNRPHPRLLRPWFVDGRFAAWAGIRPCSHGFLSRLPPHSYLFLTSFRHYFRFHPSWRLTPGGGRGDVRHSPLPPPRRGSE
jgi:hypothetical protein